jgi:hypothetical protein
VDTAYVSVCEKLARIVEAHADRSLPMTVAARECERDLGRDHVREVVELEHALVRDDRDLGAGEHPGRSDVVERRRGVEAQAVESTAGVLEASALAGVVPEGIAVKAGLLRLLGGDVSRLRLRDAPENLPTILVIHLHNYTVQTHDPELRGRHHHARRRRSGGTLLCFCRPGLIYRSCRVWNVCVA